MAFSRSASVKKLLVGRSCSLGHSSPLVLGIPPDRPEVSALPADEVGAGCLALWTDQQSSPRHTGNHQEGQGRRSPNFTAAMPPLSGCLAVGGAGVLAAAVCQALSVGRASPR